MADIQISGLPSVTSAASGDVFALDQSVGNLSKKITTANLATAIVTTTNVTAAGALMDSEITNLAQVKAFDSADYATAAQGTLAADALPKTGGAMTGAITTTSTFDGRDVATDGTKLDGIEANADVTDTANVTAAGALMDSEVVNLAQVKAFDSADYATAAQGITADAALPKTGGAMTGAITTTSTFDGRDVAADGTKLDGIEAGADVTDATNIAAAGGVIPTGTPDGSKFLRDDQVWTAVPAGGVSIGDTIGSAANNQLLITDGSGNLSEIPNIINTGGAGSLFLADDGVYKAASGSVSIGDTIGGGAFANSVLWVNGAFALSSSSKFTFDGISLNWTGISSASASSSSFGQNAGSGNSSSGNTSIGNSANQNSIGAGKTSIGSLAGQNSNGSEQVFIGQDAGYACVGARAVGVGYRSNRGNVSGGVAIGEYALYNGVGAGNTAIGVNAQNSANGGNNSSLGNRALLFNGGNNNSALGYGSGESNTGSDIVALGYNAGKSNAQNNRIIIGQTNLPQFAGEAAAVATLPAAGPNGVYLYWDTTDNTIKARI